MPNLLPQDNYDTYLSAPLYAADLVAYVNVLPTKASGYLTIYDLDAKTVVEKIKYTALASNPNRLTIPSTGRGLPMVDTAGAFPDVGTGGTDHPSNVRIALTDNVHYLGRALSQLNGDENLGGVPKLPATRSITDPRQVVDMEYASSLTASSNPAFLVTANGAHPTLTVNVGTGRFIKNDRTNVQYAGNSAVAVVASATNYVELNPATNTLSVNQAGFTAGSFPLAEAVTSTTDITGITDRRPWLTMDDGLVDATRTWTTVQTFTAPEVLITTDAANPNEGVRKALLDAQIAAVSALIAPTGVSGEIYPVNSPLYIKNADGRLYRTITTGDESTYSFVGFASVASTVAGQTATYVVPGRKLGGFTGLTIGSNYYLTDTVGVVDVTPGTRKAKVGIAVSATELLVTAPKFIRSGSFTYTNASASPLPTQTVGFFPTYVQFKASSTSLTMGMSVGDENGQVNYSQTTTATSSSNAWALNQTSGPITTSGNVGAKTQTGFTPTHSSSGNGLTYTVFWTAYSE